MNADSSGDEIRRFEEQYRRNPDGLVFARLADAHRKAGDAERALEILEEGLRRHPDYPIGHLVRARALSDMDRPEDAETSLRRVLELDPRNLVALRGLATLAEKRNDPAEAIHWLEQATIYEPTDAEVEAELARLRELVPRSAAETPTEHETLPDTHEEWWSSAADAAPAAAAPDAEAPDAGAGNGTGDPHATQPPPAAEAPADEAGDSEGAADPMSFGLVPGIVLPGTPGTSEMSGAPDSPETSDSPETPVRSESPGTPAADGDTGLSAPPPPADPNAWWFEDPGDEEPSEDGDLLTRTMAELYVKQGLLNEAAAIYRELLVDRPEDDGLRAALQELEQRIDRPEEREDEQAVSFAGDARPADAPGAGPREEIAPRAEAPREEPGPATSVDPGDTATAAPVSDAEKESADPYASHPVPRRSGTSEVYRDWLERLSG